MRSKHGTRALYHVDEIGHDSLEMTNRDVAADTMTSAHRPLFTEDYNAYDQRYSDGTEDENKSTKKRTMWRIHWKVPSSMLGYLVLGIGFALGHHFYWQSLDGKQVDSETEQEWAQRYGIVFAFLAQSALCLSVGVAFVQRVWLTIRRKPMELRNLDKAFSLKSDVFAFFSWEILRKAKLLCLLGICAWYVTSSMTFNLML